MAKSLLTEPLRIRSGERMMARRKTGQGVNGSNEVFTRRGGGFAIYSRLNSVST